MAYKVRNDTRMERHTVQSPLKVWIIRLTVMLLLASCGLGCVYYNTFYNARKAFNGAEETRKKSRGKSAGGAGNYRKAIEKSLKVIEDYPDSKYYDDALHILMVSYYYTDQFPKSERRAREILAVYPDGDYVRDATLYLAKAKLMQKDVADAVAVFQDIFDGDYDASFKSEAAMTLGTFHRDNKEYNLAEPYFMALRDSLGNKDEKRLAQSYLADGYYESYRFEDALGSYLQLLGMDPDIKEKYHSLYQAADCSYRLQRIDNGQDYLGTLMDDDVYFDSLPSLKLKMGEGYELEEELAQAEAIYRDIIYETEKGYAKAEAFWRLGLIYQYDYDDLIEAKLYYDSTTKLDRGTGIGKDALQQSSAIGLLEEYSQAIELDSSATQETIDEAAYIQYQLAELYWLELNKPDSGIIAMQTVVDSFPTAYDSPKAMIALSEMIRDHREDSTAADSILHEVLTKYPTSDFVVEALALLGLTGTEADSGYAGVYFQRAEYFLVDEFELDSARAYYQIVIDRFENSKYFAQANFALIWMTEMYDSPGDSSIIWAYTEYADSFPGTGWANEARSRLKFSPIQRHRDDGDQQLDSSMFAEVDEEGSDSLGAKSGSEEYISGELAALMDDKGKLLQQLLLDPIRVEIPFEYPPEAYREGWEGDLIFHVTLDFSGEVDWFELKTKSPIDEINIRAEETFESYTFDPTRIPVELQGYKLYYVFKVRKLDRLK